MPEPPPAIRRAVPGDEDVLALIGAATFVETYVHTVPGPDMAHHCATQHAAQRYAAWLAHGDARVWIAETSIRAPVGYLVMLPATLPEPAPDPHDLEILRIYALSRFHGQGLGRALLAEAASAARSAGARRLVLGVNGRNAKALAFYAREGFVRIGERQFRVGTSCFDDAVMGLTL